MSKIISRMFKIAKAESLYRLQRIAGKILGDWSKADSFRAGKSHNGRSGKWSYQSGRWDDGQDGKKQGSTSGEKNYSSGKSSGQKGAGPKSDRLPAQVLEDLAVFGLKPPSSLEEVRKARNREIKKYHSDKFIDDPMRYQTSKEIMQIYNAAHDRLKAHYAKSSPQK